jgi:alpha-tubulin suppressor-like RCC1 family protein
VFAGRVFLYNIGDGGYYGSGTYVNSPARATLIDGLNITSAVTGGAFTYFLSAQGQMYSCGL